MLLSIHILEVELMFYIEDVQERLTPRQQQRIGDMLVLF